MGVRIIDLETDEVEVDTSKDGGHDITPPYEYIEREDEPRLEEHEWINPLRPDKLEKIVLDDEALEKLREVIGNYNGWAEENQ